MCAPSGSPDPGPAPTRPPQTHTADTPSGAVTVIPHGPEIALPAFLPLRPLFSPDLTSRRLCTARAPPAPYLRLAALPADSDHPTPARRVSATADFAALLVRLSIKNPLVTLNDADQSASRRRSMKGRQRALQPHPGEGRSLYPEPPYLIFFYLIPVFGIEPGIHQG